MNKEFWIKVLYIIHIPITVFWFGLFLIPTYFWADRMLFQFWYAIGLVSIQYLWGILVFRKFSSICPVTTMMQLLRGYDLNDERNYKHGFIAEFIQDLNLPLKPKHTDYLLKTTFVVIVLQYIFLV